jgi:hypothetical protein
MGARNVNNTEGMTIIRISEGRTIFGRNDKNPEGMPWLRWLLKLDVDPSPYTYSHRFARLRMLQFDSFFLNRYL